MGSQTTATGNGKSGRVLVVDDAVVVRQSVCMALAHAGYEVVEAESGEQAIKVAQDVRNPLVVDVILCEIRMSSGNGVETIAFFRREYPTIPVVALTAYPDVELAVSLMWRGVFDFLVKPVVPEELQRVVDAARRLRFPREAGGAGRALDGDR
ncbi:MAG TPA: response regulator [Nitrospiraceae bacterium]|nr:response regulator [Nitrospiraceae bacterium]